MFALNAGQPLDADALSVYVSLWLDGFADLSHSVLEAAFRKTLTTCKFWPIKIADVRAHIDSAEDARCEDEWQRVIEYCRRWVNPDIGMAHAPKLPADVSHAAQAAGGLPYLESCPTDDLQWAKKRFIEDLTRQRKAGDIAALLPSSELGKALQMAAPRFSPFPPAPDVPADSRSPIEVLTSIRNEPPEPVYATRRRDSDPGFVSWQDRKAEHDPTLTAYRKEHGL